MASIIKDRMVKKWKIKKQHLSPSAFLTMGYYTNIVNNRPICANEIIKEYIKKREIARQLSSTHELSSMNMFDSETVRINASGRKEDLGRITDCSYGIEELFGYNKEFMVGFNVKIIIPGIVRDHHDSFLNKYYEIGRENILGSTRKIIA